MNVNWKFAYQIQPIDEWSGSVSIDAFLQQHESEAKNMGWSNNVEFLKKEIAKGLAFLKQKNRLFDSEDIQTLKISVLPNPDEYDMFVILICKQYNNGTTFVVSPVELPYLKGKEWG